VRGEDIRGDLHAHTFGSDGSDSVEDMAEVAQELGYEYLGITDHTPSLKIANGQSVEKLRAQIREIDKLNERLSGDPHFQVCRGRYPRRRYALLAGRSSHSGQGKFRLLPNAKSFH